MRSSFGVLALALASLACACKGEPLSPRAAEVASVIARADAASIRVRPALMAGKYQTMAGSPFAFFRGSLPLYAHDVRANHLGIAASDFAELTTLVVGLGDPHPENFGTLFASDDTAALEPNDFDAADRYPYLWDVRRLTIGMGLGVLLSNPNDAVAHDAAVAQVAEVCRAVARAYVETTLALADGAVRGRLTAPAAEDLVLLDLFRRAQRDWEKREELDTWTTLEGSVRRLRRGILDPEEPSKHLEDVPDFVLAELTVLVSQYRSTLLAPPPAESLTVLDAARLYGSGVASFPKVRLLLLVRGQTDAPEDDGILEVKELSDTAAGFFPPEVAFSTPEERVVRTSRAIWSRPDAEPAWGTARLFGLPVQIRRESEGHKNVRIARLEDELGTVGALIALGTSLGQALARAHAASIDGAAPPTASLATHLRGEVEAFADEQAEVGVRLSEAALQDHQAFVEALAVLGPTLGVVSDKSGAGSAELQQLLGEVEP